MTPDEFESRLGELEKAKASLLEAEVRLTEVTTAFDDLLEVAVTQFQRDEVSAKATEMQRVLPDLQANLAHLRILEEQLGMEQRFVDEANARNDTPAQIAALLDEVATVQRGVTRFETKVAELFDELRNLSSS